MPNDAALVTDFAGGGLPLRWFSVNDDVMGGRSRGAFRVANGTLVFSGSLNNDGGGFASLRTQARALELADAEGVRLRVRGDGRAYRMTLRPAATEGRRSISYRATFKTVKGEAWQDVWLPFSSFVPSWRGRTLDRPPVDPAAVESVGFMIADKIDGEFRLEVDSIRAYAPFSLRRLRWEKRLLVLFAPRADDERLQKQLAAVRATDAAFRERDMLVVVAAPPVAGYRPIADVEGLRKHFGVAPDEFAVKLVGKDGGVKRSASEPLDMNAVYAQIDTMPMRRSEMKEE